MLKELFTDASSELSKIVIPFTHQYTEAGLDPKQLKGADRARADVLVRAAESLDYSCYLALVTHWQSGDVDYDTWDFSDYGYRRRRSSRWSRDEDDEDEQDEASDDSGVEIGEVYDETLKLDHWLDPQGGPQPFDKIGLEESEILNPEDRENWSCQQEVHEATGNEGVSVERWYRQGAIVIWPRDRFFGILAGEGPASAVPALEQLAGRNKKAETRESCRVFAEQIITHWTSRQLHPIRESYSGRMLILLDRIGTAELVQRFLHDVLPKDFDGSEGKALHRLFQQFGWEPFAAALRNILAQQKPDNPFTHLEQIVAAVRTALLRLRRP